MAVAVNSIPGKVACHITGGVGGWYNQVEWVVLPGGLVGKMVIIR